MKTENASKAASGIGVFAALAASICCITPILALLAGASGAASAFSWLAPARPFLIGLAIVTLTYAWYRALSTKQAAACQPDGACKVENKRFIASRTFLTIITIAAVLLTTFPYYGKIFYTKAEKQSVGIVESNNIRTASFNLKGMTCASCEEHVNNEVAKVNGVIELQTSYAKGKSVVKFDKSKTGVQQIAAAINKTGYTVKDVALAGKENN